MNRRDLFRGIAAAAVAAPLASPEPLQRPHVDVRVTRGGAVVEVDGRPALDLPIGGRTRALWVDARGVRELAT